MKESLKIQWRETESLIPYGRNQKKHDEKQIRNVANSIKRFGWQQPIVLDKNDVVVIGHCRLKAAQLLKLKEVPVTIAEDLTDDEIRELRIADNKTNESPWDEDFLAQDIQELSFEGFDFGFIRPEDIPEPEERYTTKVNIPQYEIKGDDPQYSDLYDDRKTKQLISEIEFADIPEDEKDFLRMAAYRHTVFNYRNIAEHYAHAPKMVQELMERSALVIIDVDDAIANGYAKLHEDITDLMNKDVDEL